MLTKKFVKSHSVFKVKFEVRQEELPAGMNVQAIRLVGEFNGWDETAVPMTYHKKDKVYRVIVELEPGRKYQFRYLLNDGYWCNDWAADEYTANEFGEDNCVVITPEMNDNGAEDNET
jgi:1,4-alpha-glucan branching enzyme